MKPMRARRSLPRLLPYYHPYRWQVACGLASVVAAAFLASVIPSLLQRGVDDIRSGATVSSVVRLG
ncbi:hypothetical protein, partial [Gemmatimonas sp.]|uniref:hypothetical protein n=1 Tax=Gemmatimonas sp. TaxID=1962908 RepID=UPI0035693B72